MDVTSSLRSLLPYGRRSIGINQLIAKLETYLPPDQVELVQEAYDFASPRPQGQMRKFWRALHHASDRRRSHDCGDAPRRVEHLRSPPS